MALGDDFNLLKFCRRIRKGNFTFIDDLEGGMRVFLKSKPNRISKRIMSILNETGEINSITEPPCGGSLVIMTRFGSRCEKYKERGEVITRLAKYHPTLIWTNEDLSHLNKEDLK